MIRCVLLGVLLVPTALAAPAFGHGLAGEGTTQLVIGWANEPAYAGFPNAVEVTVRHDGSLRNDARLRAVVIFGGPQGERRTDPIRLEKAFGRDGVYLGHAIPTQAGRYTFHITGQVSEDSIDLTMTSGPNTFNNVQAPTEIQFPEPVPDALELAEQAEALDGRIQTLETDLAAARSDADSASTSARLAWILAIVGIVLGGTASLLAMRRKA